MYSRNQRPTKSRTSPQGGKRGCLCKNNTYNSKCCNGDLQNQGIGALTGQSSPTVFFEILAQDGAYLLTEANDNFMITEFQ
jgi:hypothetical protein|tara:strand:+ start:595 stop:837 length:243 start_codon:yes stop_codon:yes gene_type:complete